MHGRTRARRRTSGRTRFTLAVLVVLFAGHAWLQRPHTDDARTAARDDARAEPGGAGTSVPAPDAVAPPTVTRAAERAPRHAAPDASVPRLEERAPDELVALASGGAPAAQRAAALDALAYAVPGGSGKEGYVHAVLVQALADPDEDLRAQALVTLREAVPELPVAAVEQVAREDPSGTLRRQALELLIERAGESALESLRIALADPEPSVRDRARELLADLHLENESL